MTRDEAIDEMQKMLGLNSDQVCGVKAILEELVPDIMTVNGAAARAGCGRDTIIRAIRAGRLPAYNVGQGGEQSFRIKQVDLEQLKFKPPQVDPSPIRTHRRSSYKPKRLRFRSVE